MPRWSKPRRPLRRGRRRWQRSLAALASLYVVATAESEARPGKVVITPSPSIAAELLIDGKPAGRLPPFVHTVAPGRHRIEVRADGYKAFTTAVLVPSGGRPLEI